MNRLEALARAIGSRIHDLLSRMEESVSVRAIIFALTLLCVLILMLCLNACTPLMMDDFDYSISWSTGQPVSGVADVIASQAAHYRLWGGRSVVHALAQLFLWIGKPVFNIANAAVYALFLLELYALARPRARRFVWTLLIAAQAALMTCVPYFGTVFLWLTGACNYLWGTALALLPLLILRSAREGGLFSRGGAWGVLAVPVGLLAGWTNENTACAVFATVFLCLFADWICAKKPAAWQWAMLAAQGAGILLMLLAPGNFARAANEQTAPLLMRAATAVAYGAIYLGAPVAAALLLLGLLKELNVRARRGWAGLLLLGAALGALSLAASPVISDRSYTGPFALALAAALTLLGDVENECRAMDAHKLAALALCALLLGYGGMGAVREVRRHGGAWQAQLQAIAQAAQRGDSEVVVHGAASHSRFAMDIELSQSPLDWPNTSISKVMGIQVRGE